jgi:Protein of unknown function (DUF3060)
MRTMSKEKSTSKSLSRGWAGQGALAGCLLLLPLKSVAQPSNVEVRQGAGGTQVEVRQGGPGSSMKVKVELDDDSDGDGDGDGRADSKVEVRGPGSSVTTKTKAKAKADKAAVAVPPASPAAPSKAAAPASPAAPAAPAAKASAKAPKKLVLSGVNAKQKKVCTPGSEVEINGSGLTVSLKGECGAITLNGTNNKLEAEAFASIQVDGVNNAVTWRRPIGDKEPEVSVNGVGNQVSRLE